MNAKGHSFAAVLLAAVVCLGAPSAMQRPRGDSRDSLRVYPTRYYIIHTDLDTEDVKEAVVRMTKMAEEYHQRTLGFSGQIRDRLPFYLFRRKEDYYAAGGIPGSAGVFNGERLLAIAGDKTTAGTWHVIQHEGFHQFAAAVIRGERPPWLNEGIAEYFGESLFTGDGFISGIIPPRRLKRVQDQIRDGSFLPFRKMMLLSHEAWNQNLSGANYDQAWAMVQFLAHGEEGRYQQPFVAFMQALGRGVPWTNAWKQTFGDADGFEARWRDWWLSLPENPTADLYAQAYTATLTSFLARSIAQKQHFASIEEFLDAARAGTVKAGESADDWLPPHLLDDAIAGTQRLEAKLSLVSGKSRLPQIAVELPDGTRLTGNAELRGPHVARVWVDVDDTSEVVRRAQSLIEAGQKDRARAMLQQAIKSHPASPAAAEARKLLKKAR